MSCPNCGEHIPVSKSLQRGKSDTPDECPNCGTDLKEKSQSNTLLEK